MVLKPENYHICIPSYFWLRIFMPNIIVTMVEVLFCFVFLLLPPSSPTEKVSRERKSFANLSAIWWIVFGLIQISRWYVAFTETATRNPPNLFAVSNQDSQEECINLHSDLLVVWFGKEVATQVVCVPVEGFNKQAKNVCFRVKIYPA